MDYSLAILFSVLLIFSVGTAAPLPGEVVKMKSKVKWMAEQLVVRLDKDLFPSNLTLSSPDDDLDGIASITTVLDGYNSLISDAIVGVSQVKSDISSLTGYLRQWRQGHCSEPWTKPSVPGPLEELQSRKDFIHTTSFEALMRLKKFLNRLLMSLDQLETC